MVAGHLEDVVAVTRSQTGDAALIPEASAEPLPGGLDLAVIVPTYNEAENVPVLVARLCAALRGLNFEIIFVDDDSRDGTADLVRTLAAHVPQVRIVHRVGRRGLSSAVIEGIMATTAPVAAVIDGDLQHDETKLPLMLETLRNTGSDVVVGSRYSEGGGFGDWSAKRRRMSALATKLTRMLIRVDLSDPMSGFFVVETGAFRARVAHLTGVGYKILLDILSAPGPALTLREIPYEFRVREAGDSKLDNRVLLEFVELLIARTAGRYVPTKFVMFAMVGSLGVIVHMAVLTALYGSGSMGFGAAQTVATLIAMTGNFLTNNFFTYHDRMLRGWRLLTGWASFAAASTVGAIANVGVAVYLFNETNTFWAISAIAGICVGVTWNYAITALYTWKKA